MIRIAAVGDLHVGEESRGRVEPGVTMLSECADLLLVAGDLTQRGREAEARILASELEGAPVPVVAVLGNHDHHAGEPAGVRRVLEEAGVTVLEGESTVIETAAGAVGIAGVKGFGGGFAGASGTEFGEDEMKAFMRHAREVADGLTRALERVDRSSVDAVVALMHYSPVKDTLAGERLEIFPFLGSYLLAEAVDRVGADLVLHGHAHAGTEKGVTAGGIRVRNVAQPVLGEPYRVYCVDCEDEAGEVSGRGAAT